MLPDQIMPPNVKVCINGFVLSTLLFDCTNNTSDQEGFLYGSITRNVRREISDHSMSNTQEDILISICSSVPSGSIMSFYNNVGEIKRKDLENNLSERPGIQNVVGWYRFRRYSAMFPAVREQSIHRHLRDLFSNGDRYVDTSYFVLAILSSSNLPNYATHSYDYAFFIQRRDGTFKDLPLTILNLGDTRNSYRAGSMALPFMNSSSFNSVLSSSWNFDTFFDTENQIHEFHQRLRAKLDSLQEELAASDAVNASLEEDIKDLSNEMQALLATQDFENEEYLNDKSSPKPNDETVSTTAEKLESTELSICHKKASDLPSKQNERSDLPSEVSSRLMEDYKIPSPASNVEIMSDVDLQNYGSVVIVLSAFMITCIISFVIYGLFSNRGFHGVPVDETLSSSDELTDMKEPDAKETPSLISGCNSSEIPETSKSLSESDMCCETEVLATNRCGSAPAGFLCRVTGPTEIKVTFGEIISKSPSSNRSSSKDNPPFIIYAAKKAENEPSTESELSNSENKPKETATDKEISENSQPSSSKDQKYEQKDDVPQGSTKKVE